MSPTPEDPGPLRLSRPVAAALALGLVLRAWRYAMDSPLWWNEAFVAVNLLRRGVVDLLGPLDYHQVAPPLFLIAEKASVVGLGFSEWTLRLLPLLCGLASMVVVAAWFHAVAPGRVAAIATLIIAVAYHPIRLAAEVKPYAGDLLVAACVLALADHALRSRRGWNGSVALLAAATPLAIGLSYPAVFVLGGASAVLFVFRPQPRSLGQIARMGLLVASIGASFVGVMALGGAGQADSASQMEMARFWSEGMPADRSPVALLGWLVRVHLGELLAVPAGSGPLSGLPALLAASVGAVALWRGQARGRLALLVAPFALTALAAILGRYPYGERARVAQHLVPSLALLMAVGLDAVLRQVTNPARRVRLSALAGTSLVMVGIFPMLRDAARPYRTAREHEARVFARAFWADPANAESAVCLRRDLAALPWDSANPDVALYLCNQAIYARSEAKPDTEGSTVRLVSFESPQVPDGPPDALERAGEAYGPRLRSWSIDLPGHVGRTARVRIAEHRRGEVDTVATRLAVQSGPSPAAGRPDNAEEMARIAR